MMLLAEIGGNLSSEGFVFLLLPSELLCLLWDSGWTFIVS